MINLFLLRKKTNWCADDLKREYIVFALDNDDLKNNWFIVHMRLKRLELCFGEPKDPEVRLFHVGSVLLLTLISNF